MDTAAQNGMSTVVQPKEGAQLARSAKPPLPFVPTNIEEAWRLAEMVAKASLLPDSLKNKPYDVVLIIMLGAEFGVQPMTALREIYVVKGQPRMSALLKSALVKGSSSCEYLTMVESTAEKATFKTKRRGDPAPVTMSFTADEARKAGLLGRETKSGEADNWTKYTALMLRRRCVSQLCDEVYPDETRGFPTPEEDDLFPRGPESARIVGTGTTAPPRPAGATALPATGALPDPMGLGGEAPEMAPVEQQQPAPVEKAPAAQEQPAAQGPSDHNAVVDGLLGEIRAAKSDKEIDALTQRAKQVQGPRRGELGAALNAQRAAVRGG